MEKTGYLTVSSLTKYIKYKFDSDNNLKQIYIKGEISNYKKHSSGHMYFSLKDSESKINAIMFSANAKKLKFDPSEGSKVLAIGRITVFESTGAYQIYIEDMIQDGVGNLYIAFEKLKKDLYKEGLFDKSHKKSIPKFPSRVGVITAPTGAAIRDVISTIKRRSPKTEIIVLPALVQGESAAADIAKQIKEAEKYKLDVLIVGRGGGSIEDLWPFNEEIVARAIYNCSIPIISGTGHETDTTIADYVADLRAPTPTGAAEIAVPNTVDLINYIEQLKLRSNKAISKKQEYKKILLNNIKNSFVIKNPNILIDNKMQKIDIINEKINTLLINKVDKTKNKVTLLTKKIEYLNPLNLCINKQNNLSKINININNLIKLKLNNTNNDIKNINDKLVYLVPSIKNHIEKLNIIEEKLNKNALTYLKNKKNLFINAVDKVELLNPIGVLKRGYGIVYKDKKSINNCKNINVNDELKIKLHDGSLFVNVKEIGE